MDLSEQDQKTLKDLEKEIEIHSKFSHENIVWFYGKFVHSKFIYLVLEYCPGGNLF